MKELEKLVIRWMLDDVPASEIAKNIKDLSVKFAKHRVNMSYLDEDSFEEFILNHYSLK